MSHGVNFGQDRPKPAIEAKSWSHVFPFIYGPGTDEARRPLPGHVARADRNCFHYRSRYI